MDSDQIQSEDDYDDEADATDIAVPNERADSPIPHRFQKATNRGVKRVLSRNEYATELEKQKVVNMACHHACRWRSSYVRSQDLICLSTRFDALTLSAHNLCAKSYRHGFTLFRNHCSRNVSELWRWKKCSFQPPSIVPISIT